MANLKASLIFDAAQFANDAKKAVQGLNAQFAKVTFDGKKIKDEVEKVAKSIKIPKLPVEVDPASIAGLKNKLALLTQKQTISIGANLTAANKEIAETQKKINELKGKQSGGGLGGKVFAGAFGGSLLGGLASGGITTAVSAISSVFQEAVTAGIKFEKTLADLSALTGVTGPALTDLGERAKQIAKDFGQDAAEQIGVFKSILSKLGPDIAKTPAALDSLSRSVATLSAASGDTAEASVDALTASLLQFQVPTDDAAFAASKAAEFINVMAAGAKEGSAEIPQISEALKVAGTAAQAANLSFEETNAALQIIAPNFRGGAEAGTGLRNVLTKLSESRFLPEKVQEELAKAGVSIEKLSDTTLPLNERLKELKKIESDTALVQKLFGEGGAVAAVGLIKSTRAAEGQASALEKLTAKITGTNVATEQAAVNQATIAAKMDKIGANFKAGLLDLFQQVSKIIVFIIDVTQSVIDAVKIIPETMQQVGAGIRGFFSGIFEVFSQLANEIKNFSLGSIGNIVSIITNSLTTIGKSTSDAVAGAIKQSGGPAGAEVTKISDDMAKRVGEGVDKINGQIKTKNLKNIDAIKDQFKVLKDSLGADASNEAKNILFKAENDAIALFKKLNKDGSGGDKPKGDKKDDAAKKKREDDLKSLAVFIAAQAALRESQEDQELLKVQEDFDAKIEIAKKYGQDTTQLESDRRAALERIALKFTTESIKKQEQLEKELAENKKKIDEETTKQKIDGIHFVTDTARQLFGEQTAVAKLAGIIDVAVGAEKAAIGALAFGTSLGGPILGAIFEAISYTQSGLIAANIAGIKTFHTGTDYFMPPNGQREGLAILERGERVTSAKENANGGGNQWLAKELSRLNDRLDAGIATQGSLRVETFAHTKTSGTDLVALQKKVEYQRMLGSLQ